VLFVVSIPFQLGDVEVKRILSTQTKMIVFAATSQTSAECPHCHTSSTRVHSYYQRKPQDMPISGKRVQVILQVRRFRCLNPLCGAQPFAERIPEVVASYQQRTTRLLAAFRQVAAEMSGELGARALKPLGMLVSPDTLLRLTKEQSNQPVTTPKALGVDDFAFQRGRSYGTILVDLKSHHPIDLLADRTAETLAQWLLAHPGVEWISRDRAGEYARGAAKGAAAARQVADRWHLLKNLREALERVLSRVHARLQERAVASPTPFPRQKRERSWNEQVTSELSRQRRKTRYEEVIELYRQGTPLLQIAQQLHLSRGTIYKYVAAATFPERAPRSASAGTRKILDPYIG
jgi:transposase